MSGALSLSSQRRIPTYLVRPPPDAPRGNRLCNDTRGALDAAMRRYLIRAMDAARSIEVTLGGSRNSQAVQERPTGSPAAR